MMNPIRILWLIILISSSKSGWPENRQQDFQTWGNVTAIKPLDTLDSRLKNIKLWLEGQGRFGEDTSALSQAILRSGLGYALHDHLSLWLGYAWIPNEPPHADTFDEHRIWQQLIWSDSFFQGQVMLRSRLEQRFDERGDDVGWRFRQFLKYYRPFKQAPKLSWVVWNEVFIDLNQPDWKSDQGFDQNRAFLGLGWQIDKHTRTELGYINQYIRKPATQDAMNHILSLNLFLNY